MSTLGTALSTDSIPGISSIVGVALLWSEMSRTCGKLSTIMREEDIDEESNVGSDVECL